MRLVQSYTVEHREYKYIHRCVDYYVQWTPSKADTKDFVLCREVGSHALIETETKGVASGSTVST